MVTQDRDEELALFLEMRRREKEKGGFPLSGSINSNSGVGEPAMTKTVSALPVRRTAAENFLYSENEKSDYEWLLTPPGTPQFEKESQKPLVGFEVPARPTVLKSRLGNFQEELMFRANTLLKQPTISSGPNSSISNIRRASSSGGLRSSSRPATPTGRASIPSTTKSSCSRSSTPTSRATLPSTKSTASSVRSSTPTRSTSTKPNGPSVRSSTPTRSTSTKINGSQARSATPTRPSARSSTPTSRPALTATKPTASMSRAATPTRLTPSNPSTGTVQALNRSFSVQKTAPTVTASKPVPSRGASPTVRSRPWKPSDMPGFSLEAPPNLKTSLPDRPLSASRGRPGAPSSRSSSRSSSMERSSNERVRRQSCSPSRGRAPIGGSKVNGPSVPSARGRTKSHNSDNVSPVLLGSKMVERVVNMRKLAPPKQTEYGSLAKSTSSLDSLGYGRNLSKSSLDMALRHMDIRRTAGGLRPLVTKVPASSMYSVRSTASAKSRTASVSDSPLATSSTASSEPSVNNSAFCLEGSEIGDHDLISENGEPLAHDQPR